MSVATNFSSFRSNYLMPAADISSISYRYKRLTRQLNIDFWGTDSETAHSLYVGSYGRDTAVPGLSDLDVAFSLPANLYKHYDAYQSNGQSALPQAVKASIGNTYPGSYTGADGQVVALAFTDGLRFEILPVFENAGIFTFADTNGGGSWRTCDSRGEMAAFALRNSEKNDNLKAICRMARIWRDRHSVPMSGMLIDTLAYQFIASWPYSDKSFLFHDWLVRDFLLYLSLIDKLQAHWRAPGSGSYIYKSGNLQSHAASSYQHALSAIEHELLISQ